MGYEPLPCIPCSLVFYFGGDIFNETIIPLVLVGYEMTTANSYPMHTHGIILIRPLNPYPS